MFMRTDYTNITRVLIVYSASHLSLKSLPVSLSVYQVPSGRLHTSTCTGLYHGANGTTTEAEARDCVLSFSRELISLSCLIEWDLQDDLSLRTAKNSERFYADPCQAVDIKIRICHTGVHATLLWSYTWTYPIGLDTLISRRIVNKQTENKPRQSELIISNLIKYRGAYWLSTIGTQSLK